MNVLSMSLDDVLTDSKAESGSAFVSAACCIGAIEAFEYAGQMIFVYAYAVVADLYENMPVVCFVDAGDDLTILFAIFGRIFNQVN